MTIYDPGYNPGEENFTGYRLDLEDHDASRLARLRISN